jgi:hypothetical protein
MSHREKPTNIVPQRSARRSKFLDHENVLTAPVGIFLRFKPEFSIQLNSGLVGCLHLTGKNHSASYINRLSGRSVTDCDHSVHAQQNNHQRSYETNNHCAATATQHHEKNSPFCSPRPYLQSQSLGICPLLGVVNHQPHQCLPNTLSSFLVVNIHILDMQMGRQVGDFAHPGRTLF